MNLEYKREIAELVSNAPFMIDTAIELSGRPPTQASSEFLTNKEQGDWAEEIVFNAINAHSSTYCAVKYGRSDSLAAGDEGFEQFYVEYQAELNSIGKRPDLLIFRRADLPPTPDLNDGAVVARAIAAIEVRSSAFLANKYASYMSTRTEIAQQECQRLCALLLEEPRSRLLLEKKPDIHRLIASASTDTFKELDFRRPSWSTTPELRELSDLLKQLKQHIATLHKRDFLSITPKMEDLALVNRWIQAFGVPHFYLQVFFDKAYVLPFKSILQIASDPSKEDVVFSIEEDIKNQGKTTIKIDVSVGSEVLGRIDLPEHRSAMKELQRGRLLFYVTFNGGRGYLDADVFDREIVG